MESEWLRHFHASPRDLPFVPMDVLLRAADIVESIGYQPTVNVPVLGPRRSPWEAHAPSHSETDYYVTVDIWGLIRGYGLDPGDAPRDFPRDIARWMRSVAAPWLFADAGDED